MLSKAYDAKQVEDRIAAAWEASGAFIADPLSKKDPFTISMPPPNATGQLHLGHAVMLALEDIFIRFQRMRGKEVLWIPGTDHAAIATESVVIKNIQKEEKISDPRGHLGREELLKRIADYVAKSQGTIRSQIRKMGSSCDWSRERYTFDPALNRCVNEVFKKMYEDGLIYRGARIINWDPKMQTTVSDDEIEYREERSPFYTFKYGPFHISTARPETKFGDKVVVMHPDDDRYKAYAHGEHFECEWINGRVTATIVKDKAVNPDFGTGCMTITPWHDHTDFEIADRHNIDKEQIIDFEGKLLPIAGEFAGMPIEEAREKIVEKLRRKDLLVSVDENYVHRKAVSYRGGGVVEPQIKEQWFIDVHKRVVQWGPKKMSLKEVMQDVIHSEKICIIPQRFEKVYFHWIDNLRDWCISRQIWWGHQIPVYYCRECENAKNSTKKNLEGRMSNGMITVSVAPISMCPHCSGTVEQDPDTLDTWFSSANWTWATLIDSKFAEDFSLSLQDLLDKSPDYQKFHPTQVMETGYDILFFWVARMILMTTYATGQIPFKTVYLHGLVRTREGKKMSKSDPSACIDPLDMIPKYGADALRMSMIVGQSPGNDFRLYEEKIAGYRNFVNKLWNAARFVLMQCENPNVECRMSNVELSLADRAVLHTLQELVTDVTDCLEEYRLSEAGERLYGFVWDYFCDWYLELSKGESNPSVLVEVIRTVLKMLHPYCPFMTEELWGHFKPEGSDMLTKAEWPMFNDQWSDQKAHDDLQVVIDVITAIRKVRAEQGVDPEKKIHVTVITIIHKNLLEEQRQHIERLARLSSLTLCDSNAKIATESVASIFLKDVEIYLSLDGLVDIEGLQKDRDNLVVYIQNVKNKLNNKDFSSRAPVEVVEGEKKKLDEAEEKLRKIEERLQ